MAVVFFRFYIVFIKYTLYRVIYLKKKFEQLNTKLLNMPFISTTVFQDSKPSPNTMLLDNRINGLISKILKNKEFEGKEGTSILLRTVANNILLLGLGKKRNFNIAAKASLTARQLKCKTFVLNHDSEDVSNEDVEAIVQGADLGLYDFNIYKSTKKNFHPMLMNIIIKNKSTSPLKKSIHDGEIIANAIILSRDISNLPSKDCTPSQLSLRAKKISSTRPIKTSIFNTAKLKKLGFGGLLAVAQGSKQPPRFIIMEYYGGKREEKPIVFVGKTITFDTGGISIKPSALMDEMKHDKSGGATVMGIIQASADLKLPINLIGLMPATENMPGGSAYKPGDVITFHNKKTAEILNTDAEGRVILADALSYAQRYKPRMIIDFATLTGACIIALGTVASGMLGNDRKLMNMLIKSGERTGEKVWELPLWDEYKKLIISDVADIKNIGNRGAGAITAAAFLSHFVGNYPWVHLDIAGTAWTQEGTPKKSYRKKGATGVGVLLSIDFLRNL